MKKLLISSLLAVGVVASQAATITVNVPANVGTNILGAINGTVKVTSISFASTLTNYVQLWDIPSSTTNQSFTAPAYSTVTSYVTNINGFFTNSAGVVSTPLYTNYYGVVNQYTNGLYYTNVLVDVSNYVASATVNYPLRVAAAVPANTTVTLSGPFIFNNGILATNTTANASTVTISYLQ